MVKFTIEEIRALMDKQVRLIEELADSLIVEAWKRECQCFPWLELVGYLLSPYRGNCPLKC